MTDSDIVIRGAREHNLKNINIRIPRDTLTVITGVSVQARAALRSTRYSPKDNGATWNRYRRTLDSSLGEWKSLTSIILRV